MNRVQEDRRLVRDRPFRANGASRLQAMLGEYPVGVDAELGCENSFVVAFDHPLFQQRMNLHISVAHAAVAPQSPVDSLHLRLAPFRESVKECVGCGVVDLSLGRQNRTD